MVRLWDLTGRELWEADAAAKLPKPFSERWHLAAGHPGEVLGVAFSPDGQRLASGSTDWGTAKLQSAVGVIQRWDVNAGKPVGDPAEIGDAVMGLPSAPNRRPIAGSYRRGKLRSLHRAAVERRQRNPVHLHWSPSPSRQRRG